MISDKTTSCSAMPGLISTDLTKVGLSIRNRSRMLSNLVGWVTSCVRLNSSKRSMNSSYWCECLQSGAMVGKLSVQNILDSDPALECDDCGQWFHILCESVGQSTYDDWVNADRSFSWVCSKCENSNYSSLAQSNSHSFISENSYGILSEELSDSSQPSSPSPQRQNSNRTFLNKIYNLKVLNMNCQSIVKKKAEFYALLDKHKPDIVVGTESWLTPKHLDSELFPKSLGFTPFRQDRESGKSGGGVFILVRDTFIASEQ